MKRFFYILLAALLLLTLAACSKAPEADAADEAPDWQAQYDLGVRYLSEGNYEEAILAFEAAIEIDPRNADAYRKLAEAYEKTGDEDAALRTLETGAEATGDRELADLAGKKRQELDAQTEQPEQTEQSEQPEALDEPEEPAEPEENEETPEPVPPLTAAEKLAALIDSLNEELPGDSEEANDGTENGEKDFKLFLKLYIK